MNDFHDVCIRATEGRLHTSAAQAQKAYLASPEFRQRVELAGVLGEVDKFRISMHMLSRIALDPREVRASMDMLRKGVVRLRFFDYSNPVVMFEMDMSSPEFKLLVQAFEGNVMSAKFKAAVRVRKWRARTALRARHEDMVLDKLRAELPWPTSQDFKANRDKAQEAMEQCSARCRAKLLQVRDLRGSRLALLAKASAPGVGNWLELIEDIAVHALAPADAAH